MRIYHGAQYHKSIKLYGYDKKVEKGSNRKEERKKANFDNLLR